MVTARFLQARWAQEVRVKLAIASDQLLPRLEFGTSSVQQGWWAFLFESLCASRLLQVLDPVCGHEFLRFDA